MLTQNEIPNQWLTCNIMPFPKSGNLEEVGNYRGIALSTTTSKITNKMILNRIQPHTDPPKSDYTLTQRKPNSYLLTRIRHPK